MVFYIPQVRAATIHGLIPLSYLMPVWQFLQRRRVRISGLLAQYAAWPVLSPDPQAALDVFALESQCCRLHGNRRSGLGDSPFFSLMTKRPS